jgi:2-oxo-4-hydroxy-4-carboxy--5-ureidoimidazoline (OHCU) decarboxylase
MGAGTSDERRPFDSRFSLHEAMCNVVMQADVSEQLALIRAHPELAGRPRFAASSHPNPRASNEPRAVGLYAEELARIQALNAQYSRRSAFRSCWQ